MNKADIWNHFWQQGEQSSCLPNAADIRSALDTYWDEFTRGLDTPSSLIDLGCGSGALAERLARRNDGLSITGIDFASVGESAVDGVTLMSGVSMEKLPMDEGSFDGAVSQFGVEYADPATVGPEIARVLRKGAPVAFVMHHADSPVVAQNKARKAILASLSEDGIGKAYREDEKQVLARSIFEIRQKSGVHAPLVDQVARGLGQSIGEAPDKRERIWSDFAEGAANEIAIIEAMEKAAIRDPRVWAMRLGDGYRWERPTFISTPQGEKAAWSLTGRRA
ncbi:class I SAM-dependent methyltransferase [Sphingomicrobium lutaoense]|uniref:Ubiquinone/menaquinone biosynthesis C-methylase UbiE n=1 Tax=Sphingomicrobium lutaoense TaxID=515949 RepID=A0A839Z418_9SPHN|nr:class I SAM-dependent methyltransferase [Sphingomicrobium lutaoense]MBB3764573.1 ubiquinone/menaquinone biosynthesis C-methylase UbiE [Sphingomicrobium lutaoense]